MKQVRYLNPWYFGLIFTVLYSSFIFYLFATINPKGTPNDFESFLFCIGAGLATFGSIYFCYRLLVKNENSISFGIFYGTLFAFTLLLFPLVYGVYYGVIVNRLIYRGSASIARIISEIKIAIGVFHVPICFSIIVGLYNEKIFRLNQAIIENKRILSETKLIQLQQQVDPHFLFNNLNILSALIQSSTENAIVFSQGLSELYRYHLRSGKQSMVTLQDELKYMHNYFFLLESRFGEAFRLEVNETISLSKESLFIVTGTLQLLLENVVKHNSASINQPLIVTVYINDESLSIENIIHQKSAISEGLGLKNLDNRYEILTGKKIVYSHSNGKFIVKVPLIKQLKVS